MPPLLATGTIFNGWNIIGLPCDVAPRVRMPSSVEWDRQEIVASNSSPFTGQTQTYDWMQSWWEGQVGFASMERWSHDFWTAFIELCRGEMNAFMIGDPKARKPKGSAPGAPLVSGAAQTGYSLVTRGWLPGTKSILMPHDYIQIGYRLYSVSDMVDSDASGDATFPIWPPLRDQPADGTAIITRNCKGLFRLKNNSGNKDSVNVGLYGLSGFAIKEAL